MRYHKEVTAATAVVGYDFAAGEKWQKAPYNRQLNRLGYTGSTAAGDTKVEVLVEGQSYGEFANTATGFGVNNDHAMPAVVGIPANATLQVKVTDAAATNPVFLVVEFSP